MLLSRGLRASLMLVPQNRHQEVVLLAEPLPEVELDLDLNLRLKLLLVAQNCRRGVVLKMRG